jgi:hypothetical protein
MPFIGNKPSAVPLTSADITDGIITSAKIADGTIVNADINASAAIDASKLSGSFGITEADQWRITTNLTGVTSTVDVTANWERNDSTGYSVLGTGMTQSSGIFTFPSTGYYFVEFRTSSNTTSSATSYISNIIYVTTNNSTYTDVNNIDTNGYNNGVYASCTNCFILDVTSTTNVKVKFGVQASATTTFNGSSTKQVTGATFIRLGDT